jgi:hypothetical protein
LLLTEFTDKDGVNHQIIGTAFFFAPNYLLTAAHNVYGNNGKYLRVTLPEVHHVKLNNLLSGTHMLECTLVATVYGKDKIVNDLNDIAILRCGYISEHYLNLSKDLPPKNAEVNVVGYPGEFKIAWIGSQTAIKDKDQGLAAAGILFPPRKVTATQGLVTENGELISYRLSSCPGMSGGCLLYNGKVVGTLVTYYYFSNIRCSYR